MFDTILVCSDGSDQALKAAQTAAAIATEFGSRVILVHVIVAMESFYPVDLEAQPGSAEQTPDDSPHVKHSIEKHTGVVFDDLDVRYSVCCLHGNVVGQIVELAAKEEADLIVAPTRE